MRQLLRRLLPKKPFGGLIDSLAPKPETFQIVLLRRGKPEAGIYIDETREIRSPSLNLGPHADTPEDR